MKNKFIVFYTILVSFIYIFAITYFGYNISTEYRYGSERSKRRFDHMENTIKKADSSQQIENAIGNLDDFAYIKIIKNNTIVFSYPENLTTMPSETKLIKNYSSISNDYELTASIYVLRPITIYSYSKVSFLIIFVTTAITILLIIYFNLLNNSSSYIETTIDELELVEDEEEPTNIEVKPELTEKMNAISDIKSKLESGSIEKVSETITIVNESNNENQTLDEVLDSTITPITNDAENVQKSVNIETVNIYNSKPETLPEDLSKPVELIPAEPEEIIPEPKDIENNSNENTLEFRLEKELSRAISSEVDLSLLLIRIQDLSMESSIAEKISDILVEEFQYKDLVYNFSEDCFAGIKLNTTLDEAIEFADNLNHKINNVLTDNKVCFIGIAARTHRMVGAKRIILEAKEALVHAQQDTESPIVAFRVDSEKYMKFMEN